MSLQRRQISPCGETTGKVALSFVDRFAANGKQRASTDRTLALVSKRKHAKDEIRVT
ncbi:MAG: hypothetical protein ACE361_02395 [Aureliella sp.]